MAPMDQLPLEHRYVSIGIGLLLLVIGIWVVRRLITGLGDKNAGAGERAIKKAEDKGDPVKAARVASEHGEFERAANLFLKAGRPLDAARALRKAELWERAAELFEQGKDYAGAAYCFQKAGRQQDELRVRVAGNEWQLAADLARSLGRHKQAAGLLARAGRKDEAIDLLREAGLREEADTLHAEQLLEGGRVREAAAVFRRLGELDKALRAYQQVGDPRGIAEVHAAQGDHEAAAEAFWKAEIFLDAAKHYEQARVYRKAALAYQRAGQTEDAIRCLGLLSDKLAVLKLRAALGDHDEALRVAESVVPTDGAFVQAMQIAADIYKQRRDAAGEARILLRLLEAPLETSLRVRTSRKAALLFAQLGQPQRARRALARIDAEAREDEELGAWVSKLRAQLAELNDESATQPLVAGAGGPGGAPMSLDAPQPVDDELPTDAFIERTMAYDVVGKSSSPGGASLSTAVQGGPTVGDEPVEVPSGWPKGVPAQLSTRYADLQRLGQGGNGIVYRATDRRIDRTVVLKFMLDSAMPTEVARRYFLREVKLAASLSHQNIVHIYDMGETDGALWYSMEFVDGNSLTQHLPAGKPLENRIFLMSVVEQLCDALDHAHGQGLIHRDIKPDNVLVARDGVVKLLDFGLARAFDDGFGEQSVLAGTPFYMAPEQISGDTVDHRADIYALGVMLYRMFSGRLPFTENVFVAHALEAPPDPKRFNPDIPEQVVAVVLRALNKQPDERYDNCRQIRLALHNAIFGAS